MNYYFRLFLAIFLMPYLLLAQIKPSPPLASNLVYDKTVTSQLENLLKEWNQNPLEKIPERVNTLYSFINSYPSTTAALTAKFFLGFFYLPLEGQEGRIQAAQQIFEEIIVNHPNQWQSALAWKGLVNCYDLYGSCCNEDVVQIADIALSNIDFDRLNKSTDPDYLSYKILSSFTPNMIYESIQYEKAGALCKLYRIEEAEQILLSITDKNLKELLSKQIAYTKTTNIGKKDLKEREKKLIVDKEQQLKEKELYKVPELFSQWGGTSILQSLKRESSLQSNQFKKSEKNHSTSWLSSDSAYKSYWAMGIILLVLAGLIGIKLLRKISNK